MSTSFLIFIDSPDGGLIPFVAPPHPQDDAEVQINDPQINSTIDRTVCVNNFFFRLKQF
jgi:hypothetical protein